jgi:hypothetical protein
MAEQKTEIQELSEFIRDHMVTKEDLADMVTTGDLGPTNDATTLRSRGLFGDCRIQNRYFARYQTPPRPIMLQRSRALYH